MILCLLFCCLFGGSTIITTVAVGNEAVPKSIMCYYLGDLSMMNTELVVLEAKDIPCDCEIILYGQFSIDILSGIDVDLKFLKSVTDLNKPVLLVVRRSNLYYDWANLLGPDGNEKDVQALCKFANENNIAGYLLEGLTPQNIALNPNISNYIIPYIKQLSKCKPDFIIGVAVGAHVETMKSPYVYNFQELNNLVTFYEIQTFNLNVCNPELYNGLTPITKVEHGINYLLGMEEVALFIKDSQISPTKIAYDIEMFPKEIANEEYKSYSQVCKGTFNFSGGCVQNTKNFYDKGKFALEHESGIIVKVIDLDDVKNDCACDSSFMGFKNIVAGFRGGSQTSCEKYDVQCSGLQ